MSPARDAAVLFRTGDPAVLVAELPVAAGLTAVVVTPSGSAIVLGSTQPEETIDDKAADGLGLRRVRRRSGGGGVIVRPGAQLWIDLFVPAWHALAQVDLSASALFAGELWTRALGRLLRGDLSVHDGPLVETRWSRIDCFSGIGPGEVLLEGKKLVGVSQRRTREGTWLFTQAHLRFDPGEHAAVAALDPEERGALERQLARDVCELPISAAVAERAVTSAVEAMVEG